MSLFGRWRSWKSGGYRFANLIHAYTWNCFHVMHSMRVHDLANTYDHLSPNGNGSSLLAHIVVYNV
jgi:hypothetical protein